MNKNILSRLFIKRAVLTLRAGAGTGKTKSRGRSIGGDLHSGQVNFVNRRHLLFCQDTKIQWKFKVESIESYAPNLKTNNFKIYWTLDTLC